MISKKNKALCAGVLATAMSASAIVPAFASAANEYATEGGANESYAKMFESLYDDVITNGEKNGYLSKNNNGSVSLTTQLRLSVLRLLTTVTRQLLRLCPTSLG